jgi:hypothetical protein
MPSEKIYTDIDIANLALGYLGEQQIVSFEEGTREADLCSLHYNQAKKSLLELHRWSMGQKSVRLTQLQDKPAFKWKWAYQKPADCIRIYDVWNIKEPVIEDEVEVPDRQPRPARRFEVHGDQILADHDYLGLTYLSNVVESKLTPLFIQAFATHLAALMAPALGESRMTPQLLELARKQTQQAWISDVRQRKSGENSDFNYRSELENPQLNQRYY